MIQRERTDAETVRVDRDEVFLGEIKKKTRRKKKEMKKRATKYGRERREGEIDQTRVWCRWRAATHATQSAAKAP